MSAHVVDTNVPIVANWGADQAGPECVLACLDSLERVVNRGKIVLDSLGLILDEYRRNLSPSGQPGLGDAFMKWVWNNQANPRFCEVVSITRKTGFEDDFEEFPDDPELVDFHRDDRRFVAVALGSRSDPEILNSTDTDWWDHREALRRHGVRIQFLCPELMEAKR